MTPPRVLHVLEAVETGCARHLADLVTHARDAEHHLAIPRERIGGHTDHAAVAACRAAGAEVHLVEMRRSPTAPANARAVARVRRLLRRLDADVVHGHSSMGGVVARLAATGTRARRAYTPNGIATGGLATAVERALRRATDRFVAVSASEAEAAVARGFTDAAHLVVIPNGIDPTPPAPRPLRPLVAAPDDVPLVGSMGRLVPQKAPEVLVDAWARVAAARPDVRFVLIGDGAPEVASSIDAALERPPLAGRARRLPFLADAAAHLGDLDLFVLTSRFEGGPYSPLEAMRAGVAVVLTDVVGNRDAVADGRSGVLVAPDDPAATAAAVLALLADGSRRAALVSGGAEQVGRFDAARMGGAYDALYAELAALPRRAGRLRSQP